MLPNQSHFLENNIKSSFFKVKEHVLALENEIFGLKEVILKQNEVIKQLSEHLIDLSNQLENHKKSQNQPISIGNEGVNQSINHLINQSLSTQSLNHIDLSTSEPQNDLESPSFEPIEENIAPQSKPEIPVEKIPESPSAEQKIQQKSEEKLKNELDFKIDLGTISQKREITLLDKEISSFKVNINKAFSSLSKQELRVFLSLYQLDDELNGVSYIELSSKLELTEPCIRGYISTLMKKGLPITRTKLNNKRTILIINKEFKSLGLKQKLVSLYYEADPRQTTLFDLRL